MGDHNDVKIETLTKVFCVRGRFLAQESIRGEGKGREGRVFSSKARDPFIYFFFLLQKRIGDGKDVAKQKQLGCTIRSVSKSSRIARTDRSRREFVLIYCDWQLTESGSVTLTDSRARNRVGGERLRDGEHSIRIKKSERKREREKEACRICIATLLPEVAERVIENESRVYMVPRRASFVRVSLPRKFHCSAQ